MSCSGRPRTAGMRARPPRAPRREVVEPVEGSTSVTAPVERGFGDAPRAPSRNATRSRKAPFFALGERRLERRDALDERP